MNKTEKMFHDLFKVLLLGSGDTLWWATIREKAGIDPFEPNCPDHLLLLMDYYLKCQNKIFERITTHCEQEMKRDCVF